MDHFKTVIIVDTHPGRTYSLGLTKEADKVEGAVNRVLEAGLRTADIGVKGSKTVGTRQMGDAIVSAL